MNCKKKFIRKSQHKEMKSKEYRSFMRTETVYGLDIPFMMFYFVTKIQNELKQSRIAWGRISNRYSGTSLVLQHLGNWSGSVPFQLLKLIHRLSRSKLSTGVDIIYHDYFIWFAYCNYRRFSLFLCIHTSHVHH